MTQPLNLIMGARNGAKTDRDPNDFYSTFPDSVKRFLEQYKKDGESLNLLVLEPCAGNGHISKTLEQTGHVVQSWDIVQREFPLQKVCDFLKTYPENYPSQIDVLTNPPFKLSIEFIQHSLEIVETGCRVIMFLKVQFLEGLKRYESLYSKGFLRFVYVHVSRQPCALNGEFEKYDAKTQCYCWFVFEKGYKGECELRWIP